MANINATKFLPGSTATEPEKKTRAKPTIIPKRDLIVIRNRVIKIRDLVKNTTLLSEKETERKRIETEEEKFDAKEKKLEEKPDEKGEDKKSKIPGLPKLGFIDRIKSFFFKVLLGYVTVRLLPHINKLPDIVGKIGSAIDFGTDLALGLFNGLASFIDWGYRAYDATRGFLKSFGGDNVVKLFDGFGDAVNKVIDATIIAALALTSLGGDDGFGGGAGKRGFDKSGRRVGKNLQERYARRFGREQFLERFGRRNLRNLSGGMQRGLLQRGVRNAFVGTLGKGGAKIALKAARPLLKSIPILGGLIDFAINYFIFKEPLGKAAFKSIGSIAGGALGATLGSVIPFFGNIVGGLAGGSIGDWLGGLIYDTFFGNTQSPKPKVQGRAQGGPITRGGKSVGGPAKRTIKRTVKVQPTKIKPGASVGGEEKIKKIFPEVKPGDKGKKVNTLGYMKSSYDKSSSIPGFGGLFAIQSKVQLGQKPSDLDYQNAAAGLNAWMQRTFSSEIMRTSGAFAEGGSVDVGMFGSGEDMTNMIAKSLENNISPRMNDIFNDLQKQLGLEPPVVEKKNDVNEQTSDENLGPGGNANDAIGGARLFMGEGFPPLAAAILAGNVQTESGWRGQRTPWVLNDGAGTNKGLISWNRERITTAEKFLGKPLEKANNGEQVKWIKQELKQYGLLDIFLNPKSTEAELKSASYKYIGWGELGDRWQQSSRIFAAIQKGEMGTYTAGGGGAMDKGGVGGSVAEYITGDPNTPFGRFDRAGHGTTGNYHDHLAFKDRNTAVRAYNFFKSKGIQVTEFKGFDSVGGHANGSLHYSGLAFDVPGAQWGGSGAIGSRDYAGSGKVRKTLKEFLGGSDVKLAKGGRISKPTRALIGERGAEFIFDADTTRGLDSLAPNLLEYLNAAKTKSQLMGVLQSYAGYETGAEEVIEVVIPQSQMIPLPIPMPIGGGGFGGMSGGSSDSSYDSLYAGT